MVFGIGYDDDIKKAKQILTDIVENDERILKDPAPVVAASIWFAAACASSRRTVHVPGVSRWRYPA